MTRTSTIALSAMAASLFIGLPIAVRELTGFAELPVLHAVAWLLAGLVLYPSASAMVQRHQNRHLRFIEYFAVILSA